MKIGYDAKRLFCNFTGLGNYSRTLLKNLGEFYPKNNYWLYTPRIKDDPETAFFINNEAYQTVTSESKLKAWWRSFGITKQLSSDNIDIFHGLSNELPLNIHKSKIKRVVTIHDLVFKVYPKTYNPIDRKIYDFKFRKSCQNADRVIAISESTKNDIIKYYDIPPDKIDVVYQSCSPLFFDDKTNNNVFERYSLPNDYLLYTGSIIERKNLKVIINAYNSLPESYRIPLIIVGRGGSYKNEAKQLVNKLGLENKVIWLENITDNYELKALYMRARAFIYPSVYEGFGLPVAEALLCKTPVITSNVSSLPEAGGPGSILINPEQPEEMAQAIEKVLSNDGLREKMIKEGYAYASNNFSAKATAKNTVQVYKKMLKK